MAKVAAQLVEYGNHLAAVSLNRYCVSGLEAVNQAAARVRSGWSDLIIAGGVESMSRVPMGIDGFAWVMEPDSAFGKFVPQGISADLVATKYGYDRKDLDQFALSSQQRATQARQAPDILKRVSCPLPTLTVWFIYRKTNIFVRIRP